MYLLLKGAYPNLKTLIAGVYYVTKKTNQNKANWKHFFSVPAIKCIIKDSLI